MDYILDMLNKELKSNLDLAIIKRRQYNDWCYSHMKQRLMEDAAQAIAKAKQVKAALKILNEAAVCGGSQQSDKPKEL